MYRSLDRIYQIHCIIIIVFSYFNMYFSCYLGIAIRFRLVREAKVKNVAHSLFEKISTKGEHDSYSIIVLKPEYWIPPNYYFTSEKYIVIYFIVENIWYTTSGSKFKYKDK